MITSISKELPYDEFGCNESPYWYFQMFEERIELDEQQIYRESFIQAVNKWEGHEIMLPKSDYACGRRAYDFVVEAFRTGKYDRTGAWKVVKSFAAAKRDIVLYTRFLAEHWSGSGCGEIAESYGRLTPILARIENITEASITIETELAAELADLFLEAQKIEDSAIRTIKEHNRETIQNRFHNIGLR